MTKSRKPRINAQQYQQMMQLNKLTMALNAQRRDSFFRGSGFSGSDPFADMKHAKAWFDYGYPMQVDFYMHWNMAERNGLAKAGIVIPVNLCWMDAPTVREGDDDEHDETPWEKTVKQLTKRLKLWKHIKDADRMQRTGRYSALFIRVRDGQMPDKPLGKVSDGQIIELMPLWEGQLEPNDIETNPASDNYNRPVNYTYSATGTGNRDAKAAESFTIHHSRLIILSENAVGGSIYGTPTNEAGFNALLDWDKIRGSGGEASWLAAANKQILTPMQPGQTISEPVLTGINDALKDMKEGLDEALFLSGVEAKPMSNTVPDPKIYKDMALEEYAASVQIPAKVLVGTQSGVKAGDEDTAGLMRMMQSRRVNVCSDFIDSFLTWCYMYGALPMPAEGHVVAWSDLTAPSAGQKIEAALKMAQVNVQGRGGDGLVFTTDEIRKEAGYQAAEDDLEMPDETNPDDTSDSEDDTQEPAANV